LCKAGGNIVVFEHNPFNPLTKKMVRECEFDADAVLLSKSETIDIFERVDLSIVKSGYTLFIPSKLKELSIVANMLGW